MASTVLKRSPDSAEAHADLANVLRRNGYLGEAIIRYTEALRLNPNLAEAHNGLGNALTQRGDVNAAISHYQKAIEINPEFAEAYNNLGNALMQKGDINGAILHCEKAIELKPSDVSFLNNLAFVLATTPDASLRNGSKAIDLAKRANELSDWNQPDVLATLAAAYAELHRFTDAVEIGQKADQLAKLQGNLRLAQRLEHDIQLYREGNPLRLGSLTDPGSKAP